MSSSKRGVLTVLIVLCAWASAAEAGPIAVRFPEGVTRGFPVLRSVNGEKLAQGELTQVPRGDSVQSRLVFRFTDGSVYDETVVFSQRELFRLVSYRVIQYGPSFPETLEASIDRQTGQYRVRYRADDDSPEELMSGSFSLPPDVYNGMLGILMKNFLPQQSETVEIVAFTPKPRLVKVVLEPAGEDQIAVADRPMAVTRYLIRPQLGMFASLLIADLAPLQCWILSGDAPAFLKFEGPLYFMGPAWRIELN